MSLSGAPVKRCWTACFLFMFSGRICEISAIFVLTCLETPSGPGVFFAESSDSGIFVVVPDFLKGTASNISPLRMIFVVGFW